MRNEFCRSLVASAAREDFVFLTGDLGFGALEPLRDRMGRRFINAGVAEQNMVSVAAGLARSGLRPWVYSIGPFMYARPFEQIRNDVAMHDLPVRLVGNGGGYGYGVMGGTHHALEDYGVLLTLPNMTAFVPAFRADVSPVVQRLFELPHPAYLRLGLGEEPEDYALPAYAPWRKLTNGAGATVLAVGPLVGPILAAAARLEASVRPRMWVVCELPILELPTAFVQDVRESNRLLVIEEHVAQGGAGAMIAEAILRVGLAPRRFHHAHALGYPSGRYGSQRFHRKECALDPDSVINRLLSWEEA